MSPTPVLIKEAMQTMRADPARAATLCRAILQSEPRNLEAALLLSEALRLADDLDAAHAIAAPIAIANPRLFGAQRQLGVILAAKRSPLPASLALRAAADINPAHPTIWRDLADQLALAGDVVGAQTAYARHAASPTMEPRLVAAGAAIRREDFPAAEQTLREHVSEHPTDVNALRMVAEVYARAARFGEAEAALRRVIELAPRFSTARHSLGQLLIALGRADEAVAEARALVGLDRSNQGSRRLLGAALNARNDYAEAAEVYEALVAEDAGRTASWSTLGHIYKTMGQTEQGIDAYRKSVALDAANGDAWWGLANLKTVRLSDEDIVQLKGQLARTDLSNEDRVSILYTLGKALEQRDDVDAAFAAYAEGAAVRTSYDKYDPFMLTGFVDSCMIQQREAFFSRLDGNGDPSPDPIFILGLPRSGSTLVEQVLASHSHVEGTMELADLQNIVRDMGEGGDYHAALAATNAGALRAMGETYLRTTRSRRKLGRAFFIDKMPNNWSHVGLIHLMLPNAKIIDTRRHPMACGWSCFKQHFPLGQTFTYDLAWLGRYYADYVNLMAHYDAVLPGRVHRVIHEPFVQDPEPHIRALLDYCGLPFEDQCLRPHETKRAVHTASAEQVRQPISAKGLDEWRAFEAHLEPLRIAIGPVLDGYPEAPK